MAITRQSIRALALAPLFLLAGALLGQGSTPHFKALQFTSGAAHAANSVGDNPVGTVTGLRVPRLVTTQSARVTVRSGPDRAQDVRWVYTRAGMPVEITAEYDNWRRVLYL